jgi:hypothetical protein
MSAAYDEADTTHRRRTRRAAETSRMPVSSTSYPTMIGRSIGCLRGPGKAWRNASLMSMALETPVHQGARPERDAPVCADAVGTRSARAGLRPLVVSDRRRLPPPPQSVKMKTKRFISFGVEMPHGGLRCTPSCIEHVASSR